MRYSYIFICLLLTFLFSLGFCDENSMTKIYEKILFDGDSVMLFKEVYYEKRDKPKDFPKNWTHNSELKIFYYTMTLVSKADGKVENIWNKKVAVVSDRIGEPKIIGAGRFNIVDIRKYNEIIYILYTIETRINLDKLRKNDEGKWIVINTIYISRETDCGDDSATTGKLIKSDDKLYATLEYVYDNQDMPFECWSLSEKNPKLLLKSDSGEDYEEWLELHKPDAQNNSIVDNDIENEDNTDDTKDNNTDNNAEKEANSDADNKNNQNAKNASNSNDVPSRTSANMNGKNADADSTDVPSTTLRNQESTLNDQESTLNDRVTVRSGNLGGSGNKSTPNSDADIFVILGISTAAIILILIISLVIIPKVRK